MADLQVGIIGVHAERGWARESHVPAVQALTGLQLAAVANRTQEAADAAAASLGVRGYGDPADLIADPSIDIVTAASVPAHHDLLVAAIGAGKLVVTEWPVGTSTAKTEEIAALGDGSGLRTAVGLQSRMNPAAIRAVDLVTSGAIGRVLSATVYSFTAGFGRAVAANELYLEEPDTGMNLTTIQTAHTLDFAIRLAGRLTSIAALTTVPRADGRRPPAALPEDAAGGAVGRESGGGQEWCPRGPGRRRAACR